MAVGTPCRDDGHVRAYWPCTASRFRFAGLRCAQPALDPVPGLNASARRRTSAHEDSDGNQRRPLWYL